MYKWVSQLPWQQQRCRTESPCKESIVLPAFLIAGLVFAKLRVSNSKNPPQIWPYKRSHTPEDTIYIFSSSTQAPHRGVSRLYLTVQGHTASSCPVNSHYCASVFLSAETMQYFEQDNGLGEPFGNHACTVRTGSIWNCSAGNTMTDGKQTKSLNAWIKQEPRTKNWNIFYTLLLGCYEN